MPLSRQSRLPGELAAVAYMAGIALLAQSSRASVFLFPELGAIAFGVCVFRRGAWARAPGLLMLTPFLTAVCGTVITRNLPHPEVPSWAHRSWVVPIACSLSAIGGLTLWSQLGDGPLTAALAMAWGLVLLRALDLYLPPVLAVALLPLVIPQPDYRYPLAVGLGALILTATFVVYRQVNFREGSLVRHPRRAT